MPEMAPDVAAMHERVRDGRYAGVATTELTQMGQNYNQIPYSTFDYRWMMYKPFRNSRGASEAKATLHMKVGWTITGEDIYALIANNDNCQYCIVEDGRKTDVRRHIAGSQIDVWAAGLRDEEIRPRKGSILTSRGEIIKRALKEEAKVQNANGTAPSRYHNDQLQNVVDLGISADTDADVVLPTVAGPVATLDVTLLNGLSMSAINQTNGNTIADVNMFANNEANVTHPADVNMFANNEANDTLTNGFNMFASNTVDNPDSDIQWVPGFNPLDPALFNYAPAFDGSLLNGAQPNLNEPEVVPNAFDLMYNTQVDLTELAAFAFDGTLPVNSADHTVAGQDDNVDAETNASMKLFVQGYVPGTTPATDGALDNNLDMTVDNSPLDNACDPLWNCQDDLGGPATWALDDTLPVYPDLCAINAADETQPTIAEPAVAEPAVAEPAVAEPAVTEPFDFENAFPEEFAEWMSQRPSPE